MKRKVYIDIWRKKDILRRIMEEDKFLVSICKDEFWKFWMDFGEVEG